MFCEGHRAFSLTRRNEMFTKARFAGHTLPPGPPPIIIGRDRRRVLSLSARSRGGSRKAGLHLRRRARAGQGRESRVDSRRGASRARHRTTSTVVPAIRRESGSSDRCAGASGNDYRVPARMPTGRVDSSSASGYSSAARRDRPRRGGTKPEHITRSHLPILVFGPPRAPAVLGACSGDPKDGDAFRRVSFSDGRG